MRSVTTIDEEAVVISCIDYISLVVSCGQVAGDTPRPRVYGRGRIGHHALVICKYFIKTTPFVRTEVASAAAFFWEATVRWSLQALALHGLGVG